MNAERAELGMIILRRRRFDFEAAVEAFAFSKIAFADLMTYRAGDAVFGIGIFLGILVEGNVRENFAEFALQLSPVAIHWHVAIGASVFNFRL